MCSLVFLLGSTLVILFYSCHLFILLSSPKKWPSATSFLIGYVCSLVFSLESTLVIWFYSCHLLILLSSLKKWPSATSFWMGCVCSLVFSLGSTLVILFYSCHLLILLSSLEKWPSATSFLIRYVCSLVFRSGSFLRMARDWHLPKKTAAVLHGLNPMVSGSEASSARIFYPECGSQDILFPYTELPIDDFWLWGFKG